MASSDRPFRDRKDAGRQLAEALEKSRLPGDTLVLGLPRGGVVVAYEVAVRFHLPLDVLVVRKLGVPGQEELAMGAIASGGEAVLNEEMIASLGLSAAEVDRVIRRERRELARRERLYRGDRPPLDVRGRTVLVVDDGLATGATMRVAVTALRRGGPARLVAAVPVGSPDAYADIAARVEEIVCLTTPDTLLAIGEWYDVFEQTSDDEVIGLLSASARGAPRRA